MSPRPLVLVPCLVLSLVGCRREEGLTREEAAAAVEELEISSQAQSLTASTVEVTTNFTIGDAVEKAASDLRAFIQTQIPCADIAIAGAILTVEYGARGACFYNGNAFTGTHTVSISRNEQAQVLVDHVWDGLSNGRYELSGTSTVTWTLADPSRHVEHDLTWTRLADGRTGRGEGNRIQRPLDDGIAVGFSEDGSRSWVGERGRFDLEIDELEMRWIDPVPQSGSLTLDTPFDKTVSVTFARRTETRIRVSVEGPGQSYSFDVGSLP